MRQLNIRVKLNTVYYHTSHKSIDEGELRLGCSDCVQLLLCVVAGGCGADLLAFHFN